MQVIESYSGIKLVVVFKDHGNYKRPDRSALGWEPNVQLAIFTASKVEYRMGQCLWPKGTWQQTAGD